MEHAIVGAAAENKPAAGGEHRSPVGRLGIVVGPHAFAGVDIPRLNFTDVVCARSEIDRTRRTGKVSADYVFNFSTYESAAEIFIGRNIDHSSLWTEGDRWPILSSPVRRTVVCHFSGAGLAHGIHVGTAGFGIKTLEDVLPYKGRTFNEIDFAVGALEKPKVTVASDVDQALDVTAIAFVIDQNWRRDFIPIPRIVGVILVVSLEL